MYECIALQMILNGIFNFSDIDMQATAPFILSLNEIETRSALSVFMRSDVEFNILKDQFKTQLNSK